MRKKIREIDIGKSANITLQYIFLEKMSPPAGSHPARITGLDTIHNPRLEEDNYSKLLDN